MRRSDLPVSRPCTESWDALPGSDRTRHCARCDRDVVDVSARTWLRARLRLALAGPSPCVRYTSRPDGSIVFRPGLAARALLAVAALFPARAEAGEDRLGVWSWVAPPLPEREVGPDPRMMSRIDFGGTGPPDIQIPARPHPHGPAVVEVEAAPGRWAEVAVSCVGSPGAHYASIEDGGAHIRGLPDGAECTLSLSGGDGPREVTFVAGHAMAELEVPREEPRPRARRRGGHPR